MTTKKSSKKQRAPKKRIMTKAEYEAEAKTETRAAVAEAKPRRALKERKPSGLDAAAQVLAEAGEPLSTAEMVKRMLAEGLWKTSGKTPAATIYAAIIRECAEKGDQSRFRKVELGKFMLAK
jgi:hypothetical protein